MKRTIAFVLVFVMLSSIGAMCFAKVDTSANDVSVSCMNLENNVSLGATTQAKETQKDKLVSDLNDIANDESLDSQSAFSKAWDCIKNFVKENCSFIVTITCVIVVPVLCHYFGKDLVTLVLNTIEKIQSQINKERKIQTAK